LFFTLLPQEGRKINLLLAFSAFLYTTESHTDLTVFLTRAELKLFFLPHRKQRWCCLRTGNLFSHFYKGVIGVLLPK
jgi:hypothetical protein